MSVNLKQVYNAIHDLGREIVMLESPDDGIGIAFETDGGIIRCEFDGARKKYYMQDVTHIEVTDCDAFEEI